MGLFLCLACLETQFNVHSIGSLQYLLLPLMLISPMD